jgi:Domain of unknown function (DUF4389)
MPAATYPVRVDASLDSSISRWLWLVKWVLVIPHYIVLGLLWIAFVFLSIGAFFAILFTRRYPRSIFDFNVGVLRWTWRVQYYSYAALGTDRYPPFSLGAEPGYPARLEIEYPGQLSRGLVLVKWWLLAIPHYIIIGLFAGGGSWLAARYGRQDFNWAGGGLIGVLVLVAAIVLLFTGRYPQPIFDFVLGMNRWILRVAAYVGLMTDQYPPFRFDMGGSEPGGTLTLPPPGPSFVPGSVNEPAAAGSASEPAVPGSDIATGWRAGRVVSVVIGSILALASVGLISGGGFLLWAGQTHRQDGYLTTNANSFATGGYALASGAINLPSQTSGEFASLVGTIRIRATAPNPARPIFIGIAPAAAVSRYLSGVPYTTVPGFQSGAARRTTSHLGTAAPVPPAGLAIWTAQASGTGTRSIIWTPRSGNWTVVVMNPDASRGVTARTDVGATIPGLPWIVTGLLVGGLLLAVGGILLIVVPVRRVSAATSQPSPA